MEKQLISQQVNRDMYDEKRWEERYACKGRTFKNVQKSNYLPSLNDR